MNLREVVAVIRGFNPMAGAWQIGAALHVETAEVEAILAYPSYDAEVAYVRKIIPQRGRIYEGCRPAFESGKYKDETLARMLSEGVLAPAKEADGGYILGKDR